MSIAIVVAGDSNIFALSYGCLLSLQPLRGQDTYIYFLDIGCTKKQQEIIRPMVEGMEQFRLELAIEPAGEKRPYWKAQGCRPFLPNYFGSHDTFIWLDSDTWVQDTNAIAEIAEVAEVHGVAIAPEIDAGYEFLRNFEDIHRRYGRKHQVISYSYGSELADKMLFMPYFNTGVFAISKKSGIFEVFEDELRTVFSRGYTHVAEQICLNKILLETGKYQPLPAVYNWMCNLGEPVKNHNNVWTTPTSPFYELKIVHLCGKNKIAKFLPMGLLFEGGAYLDSIALAITENDGYYV